jgi:ParB-like chromosome segregation protein Spo0J
VSKIAKLNKPLNNRIIGHGEEAVDQLLANPLNYRLHPDNQQQALAGAIDDIGFIRSVTVNQRTGRVVDGHLRVTLAARSGVESLPVEYVDLSEAEEAQALLSLDPIAAMAASDKAKLEELMASVQSDDERVQAMMAEMGEKLSGFQFDPDTLVDSFSGAVDGDSEYGSVTLTDKRDIIEEIKELVKSVGMETACALFLEVLKNA